MFGIQFVTGRGDGIYEIVDGAIFGINLWA
jgi:hypothetical protein